MEPGWVEIMPRKRVTDHVRTWLLSAQTEGCGRWRVRAGPVDPGNPAPSRNPLPQNPRGLESYELCLLTTAAAHTLG